MPGDKTILLVEDNPDDEALTLRAIKKSHAATVIVARDGVEALDYLFGTGEHAGRDTSVQPQLMLLDLNLPRISGLEVLQRVRADERTRLLAVVVLTSSLEEQDVLQSYSLGANAYIRKPVDFAQFTEAIKTLGLFWLLLNQPAPRRRPT